MPNKKQRKPIAHFFIKKDLQIRLIKKIVFAVLLSTIVAVVSLLATYLITFKSTVFYRVTLDLGTSIGDRENIIAILLPSLIVSGIINIIIGIGIGLYSSRKYALPIFKLEQWVSLLNSGQLNVQLHFREKTEMRELCDSCNQLSQQLCVVFSELKKNVEILDTLNAQNPQPQLTIAIQKLQKQLNHYSFDSEIPLPVTTTLISMTKEETPKSE